jgi:hypothetical protein
MINDTLCYLAFGTDITAFFFSVLTEWCTMKVEQKFQSPQFATQMTIAWIVRCRRTMTAGFDFFPFLGYKNILGKLSFQSGAHGTEPHIATRIGGSTTEQMRSLIGH